MCTPTHHYKGLRHVLRLLSQHSVEIALQPTPTHCPEVPKVQGPLRTEAVKLLPVCDPCKYPHRY